MTGEDPRDETTYARPTGGLLVEIYPIGVPGMVAMGVRNLGPTKLTRDEAIRTLRSALEDLERLPNWEG